MCERQCRFILKPSTLKESIDGHKFLDLEAAEDCKEEENDVDGPASAAEMAEQGPISVIDPVGGS